MKIETTTPPVETSQKLNNKITSKPTAETEKTKATDSINLSIEAAFSSLKSTPTVNAERVAELKSAIENGSYTIDNEKLANNIITSERELSNTG
ncbi:flagellar biosynthesis anti-sigma factor FlgM [methanotrophic endosymbiont of Bathymodiolus puteoserpentis (Logatchev)]|jgi:negative regulator of flagellin synthesis FlgM|uniref:flagellar biosynthesis anti-sigma factor FlgM n=1 Tax=methanotrophic endosymbiont of Bathymodiolus puteoserpentis (Logatchev) TaxID=343235 RepID=UPI00157B0791|nr:flagellar biosynthesis anti-sigma factor FlgM [methanotrophic endosymbiont of Bathymodiolus puteoserpentis (Logatchev)]